MSPGDNLFSVPLTNRTSHSVSFLFSRAPVGTTISLWSPTANAYTRAAEYLGGSLWTDDFDLPLGLGAKLTAPASFTFTAFGDVRDHAGGSDFTFPPPPVFTGPPGTYLLGDKAPVASTGNATFLNVLGRLPMVGERFSSLNRTSQVYTTSTFLPNGTWDITPSLTFGEAAFYTIVPEPSSATLALLGGLILFALRKR
jgi:hypothetical protein